MHWKLKDADPVEFCCPLGLCEQQITDCGRANETVKKSLETDMLV